MNAKRLLKPALVLGAMSTFLLALGPAPAQAADRDFRRGTVQTPQAVGPNSLAPKAVAPNSLIPKATLPAVKKTLPMRQTPLTDTSPALQKVKPGAQAPKGSLTGAPFPVPLSKQGLSPGAQEDLGFMKKIGGLPVEGMNKASPILMSPGAAELPPPERAGEVLQKVKPAEFEPTPGAFEAKGGMALPGAGKMEDPEEEDPVQAMPSPGIAKGNILGGGPGPGPTEAPLAGK
jgi:hypothetical protein